MIVLLSFFSIGILLELTLLVPYLWQKRAVISWVLLGVHASTAIWLLDAEVTPYALIALVVLIFRSISLARIPFNRLHHTHLKNAIQRSTLVLILLQLLSLMLAASLPENSETTIMLLSATQFLTAGLLLSFVVHSIHQTRYDGHKTFLSDKELPSITVAIPARNETQDLASCIESVLGSNYPKLEILVLDDCSQDKTPDVIKHYAHAGVRFLQGTMPERGWLAKNQAYHQLSQEASGAYIVFCGVDVRMSPEYLRNLITHAILKNKDMLSVLPLRLGGDIRSSFIQPMRYWWELALPRKLLNRPAVLSTCWAIKKATLDKLGAFEAVKRNILPERYFARECVANDTYGFVRANEKLDLRTVKSPHAQFLTSLRVRYPQLQNRPENILVLSLTLHLLLLTPYTLFAYSTVVLVPEIQILSGLSIVFLSLSHAIIMTVSNPANSLIALVNFPFVVLTESSLAIYSMLQYEFGKVLWKGRNVCIPIAQKATALPRLRK